MKNRKFIWSALLVSIILMSCSENDNIVEQNTPEDTVTTDGFKILAATDFTSELGEIAEDASTETRTPAAVDANGRPTEQYMLNYVNVLKVDREQPTTEDIGKFGTLSYVTGSQKFEKHEFGTGGYEVEYEIVFDSTQYNGCTRNGTVTLKYQNTKIPLTLTVFETSKLEQNYITINDFPYDKTNSPRGSSLYYLTYDPQENDGIKTLPTLGNNNITTIVGTGSDGELHHEQADSLFVSNELIFCADDTKLYVYEIVEAEGDYGGYHKIREYDLKTTTIQRTVLNMSRLTSMISASFMLVDDAEGVYDKTTSYFDGYLESSAAKFKETFNTDIDLTTIKCPYATVDGMNTIFDINDGIVSDPGRLLLWGKGYSIVGNDGNTYGYDCENNVVENAAVNLLYSFPVQVGEPQKVARGIGIKGMSYCAVYRGVENDTKNQPISFYITVNDGGVSKNIKITGFTRNGYPMSANKATHIIMLIPAKNFVDYVESVEATVTGASNMLSRTGDNGFSEFVVPSENVFVK